MAPQGWHRPERVARRTMGEPTLCDTGIRLMQAGNPEGWHEQPPPGGPGLYLGRELIN